MTIFNVISMLGGLALFLYGMRIMGDGLKQGSSETLKKAMSKVTNSPVTGFLLGMGVTALIQSATATIVLTSGLVGAGIITLHQSLGIVLGANVGTTVTAQIIRLLDVNSNGIAWLEFFKPTTLAPLAAIIGIILIMTSKSKSSNTVGNIAIGFAVLFTGILNMTAATDPLKDSPAFAALFLNFSDRPFLGFLAGTVVALATQSSSASIGILQALSVTGQLSLGSIYSIIIGIYMGDAITTAIVCTIGAKADAKRTGFVNILFNCSEVILVTLAMTILHRTGALASRWSTPITSGGIANTHSLFNLSCAIVVLPFISVLEKVARKVVKDDKEDRSDKEDGKLRVLDRAFLNSPVMALSEAHELIRETSKLSCSGVQKALALFREYNEDTVADIRSNENRIDHYTDSVQAFLVELAPHLRTQKDSDLLNYYIQCASEFERIGDYADNLCENAQELSNMKGSFSPEAAKELSVLCDALDEIMQYTVATFDTRDPRAAFHIEPVEEVIDDLVERLKQNHIERLRQGQCSVSTGSVFLDLLVNAERIADQCSNVGVHTVTLNKDMMEGSQHDYIHDLHHGLNEEFNIEYKKVKKYYDALLSASSDK